MEAYRLGVDLHDTDNGIEETMFLGLHPAKWAIPKIRGTPLKKTNIF